MKIMVASDIHGSAHWCGRMLECFERERADRLLLLGDILYHGPRNDLPAGYAPKEVLAMLNRHREQILAVRGNCDAEVDQMVLAFPILAECCLLTAGGRLITATHGHIFNREHLPPLRAGDILLHGHTHVPTWETTADGVWILNPGSVALPKENTPHGVMMLDDAENLWKDLDGDVYHAMAL